MIEFPEPYNNVSYWHCVQKDVISKYGGHDIVTGIAIWLCHQNPHIMLLEDRTRNTIIYYGKIIHWFTLCDAIDETLSKIGVMR